MSFLFLKKNKRLLIHQQQQRVWAQICTAWPRWRRARSWWRVWSRFARSSAKMRRSTTLSRKPICVVCRCRLTHIGKHQLMAIILIPSEYFYFFFFSKNFSNINCFLKITIINKPKNDNVERDNRSIISRRALPWLKWSWTRWRAIGVRCVPMLSWTLAPALIHLLTLVKLKLDWFVFCWHVSLIDDVCLK